MSERIHTCGSGEASGQRIHQFSIDHGYGRDIIGVDTHHLLFLFLVDYDVVDSGFGSRTGRGGERHHRHALVLRRRTSFERHHVGKLRIGHYNTDTFGGIHGRSATDSNQQIGSRSLESSHTVLHVLHSRIGLHLAEHIVGDSRLVEDIGHHLGHSKLDEAFVSHNQCLFLAKALYHFGEHLARSGSEIGRFVQYKSLNHNI